MHNKCSFVETVISLVISNFSLFLAGSAGFFNQKIKYLQISIFLIWQVWNLRNKKKWLLCCSYNPKKDLITQHLYALSKSIDVITSKYDNLLFLGDFNAGVKDTSVKNFCRSYNLTSVINKPTCYKNPDRPSLYRSYLNRLSSFFSEFICHRERAIRLS